MATKLNLSGKFNKDGITFLVAIEASPRIPILNSFYYDWFLRVQLSSSVVYLRYY